MSLKAISHPVENHNLHGSAMDSGWYLVGGGGVFPRHYRDKFRKTLLQRMDGKVRQVGIPLGASTQSDQPPSGVSMLMWVSSQL